MNKKAKIALEILIILIIIAATSAVMLVLVKTGVIGVKDGGKEVLNTEFIPYSREGSLAIRDFSFCQSVDAEYKCIGETNQFIIGDNVFFVFTVESSPYQGKVNLIENYRVKGPQGNILLEANSENNFYLDKESKKNLEQILISDYIISDLDDQAGEYILELIIENPLLNKKTTLTQTFELN